MFSKCSPESFSDGDVDESSDFPISRILFGVPGASQLSDGRRGAIGRCFLAGFRVLQNAHRKAAYSYSSCKAIPEDKDDNYELDIVGTVNHSILEIKIILGANLAADVILNFRAKTSKVRNIVWVNIEWIASRKSSMELIVGTRVFKYHIPLTFSNLKKIKWLRVSRCRPDTIFL
jgi:hypothetical protein